MSENTHERTARQAEHEQEYDEFGNSAEPAAQPNGKNRYRANRVDFAALEGHAPPERMWAIPKWIPMSTITLLSGPGGIGKTMLAQAMATCLALRREYLELPPEPRCVLMWACEDDVEEIWRRQVAISRWLEVDLADANECLHIHSYDRFAVELAGLTDYQLLGRPMLNTLREQIGDYKAEVVFLDNIARLYGGSENDRHQVSTFIAMLQAAASPTHAAVVLIGHPAKMPGSEYSGSTAWEAAVRSRLYFGAKLPDAPKKSDGDETPDDPNVRYLCRRKANYADLDWRRVHYIGGVLIPEIPPEELAARGTGGQSRGLYAQDCVIAALRKLIGMGHVLSSSPGRGYLPKLAEQYQLLNGIAKGEFVRAMRELELAGRIVTGEVGKYANRSPRMGLKIP